MVDQTEPVPGPDVLLNVERGVGATLHEQIEQSLREHVRSGRLRAGSRVPSSRALAGELGVSRGVVLEAYAQLVAEGYLISSHGAPTRVAPGFTAERPPLPAASLGPRHRYDFDPGVPDLTAFPRERWVRSLRAALRAAPFDLLGAGDPRGIPQLRNELLHYISRARGAAPEPEHTLICSGFAQGFATLCRTLKARGLQRVAIERPGYPRQRQIAEQSGLEAVPIAVDELGLDVAALAASGCEVVVVTPAHQYPTGVVLASERRSELLEWADEEDALIVEDDYDSELRYDRPPVGALQGLAPERVCHIGSLSKRLAPGLGVGWVLSPSWLTGALTYEKATADGGTPVIEQLALSDFIARGELDRHLRRMRLRYRRRRDTLIAALTEAFPGDRTTGIASGLFVTLLLADRADEEALVGAAAERGVGVEGLAGDRAGDSAGNAAGPAGLILGFGNLPEAAIAEGIRRLAGRVRIRHRGPRPT
jgi:GntR family transcriptional regulator / MocR family aminotransferase